MTVTADEQGEVQALLSRYARSVDAADVAAVLECLAEDVLLEYEDGRLVIDGRAQADTFFRDVLRGPSTHLLANHGYERIDGAIVASCSAIACVCRKPGLVSVRGLVYRFTCERRGATLVIRRLQHSLQWEFDAPGGAR
jgi:hypothetical protein